ncbi:MAG: thioredoxin-dependent thiol peroxidase [Alphaproteobacteria bacterium]
MTIEVGDRAPAFHLQTDGASAIKLAALKGKNVVLYFYPKDNTSGCTAQACAFRDLHPKFKKLNAVVIGVSRDSVKSHDGFKDKYKLPFALGADEDGKVSAAYGTWIKKSMYGRSYMGMERATFLIDKQGVIRNAWRKVKVPGHIDEVLEALKALD